MRHFTSAFYPFFTALIVLASVACNSGFQPASTDPAFAAYISAYTDGVISSSAPIVLQLTEPIAQAAISEIEELDVLCLHPHVEGAMTVKDARTLVFEPLHDLEHGTDYQVSVHLSKIMDVPDELADFIFHFSTIEQAFEPSLIRLKSYGSNLPERQYLEGSITTADKAENGKINELLTAIQNGVELPITWDHSANGMEHRFTIDSIKRMDLASVVSLSFNGSTIGVSEVLKITQDIPALGDFKVLSTQVIHQPDQYVIVTFSDPIDGMQDLEGLIDISGIGTLSCEISNNELRIYPSSRYQGERTLSISAGLKNSSGYKIGSDISVDLTFEELKPMVRNAGSGTILPSTDGSLFPFEAVNLSAVDVNVIRIFENNIHQFLQINDLAGNDQVKRVGRSVKRKTVRLNEAGHKDLGQWNRFFLDLYELIEVEKGAIYRIELGFRRSHSLYSCSVAAQDSDEFQEEDWDNFEESESSYWDYFDTYYYDWYYGDYNYRERNDPCSGSYYGRRRNIARNILASDIGLIAKGGNDRSLLVAVSDLITTEPLRNVQVDVLNFQAQKIHQLTTDENGLASVDLTREKPFMLIAHHKGQKGYLKLDDGSSMNLSKFEIQGHQVQKGLKGYLYGDRGVWRPGDSLYLGFILKDDQDLIPDHHPVSFELTDPRGVKRARSIHRAHSHGFYDLRTSTTEKSPTGTWRATVKVGNAVFTKPIRIETVKPNRLKIELKMDKEMLSHSNPQLSGELKTRWLHGAVAGGLRSKIELSLSSTSTQFERYGGYEFDDPVRKFSQNSMLVFDGTVDNEGRASLDKEILLHDKAPGMLSANFVTRVFEKGGDHSIDRHSIKYSPYGTYVGMQLPKGDKARGMLLTDTTHVVDLITLNEDGSPVSSDSVHVAIYKIQWRWWWQSGTEDLEKYFGRHAQTLMYENWVSTNDNGSGEFRFELNYPEWGRYLVRATHPDGHASGKIVYIDWPGWAGRAQRNNPEAEQMLVLSSDKREYDVHETADLFIPTSGHGRALLTIENGSKVLHAEWLEAKEGGVRYPLLLTEEMAPNVYAHVTYVQPHGNTRNSLPIRMYGLIPIMVEDPKTRLDIQLEMPDELAPLSKFELNVSERNGIPMTYTIAIVDEGLLDLTRFQTPDAWEHFFAKEAIGVRTWDMYGSVIGAFGGRLSPLLALGGDGTVNKKGKARSERFKPMVRYLGPFELKANSSATHSVEIPNYVGSVRTMIVAGNGDAYGQAEKTTPVKKPLMLLATLPRVVSPGEKVRMPVSVFAMDKKVKNVAVEVSTNDLFSIVGAQEKNIRFEHTGDQLVEFDLKVAEQLGPAQVIIEAGCGKEKAYYKVDIEVRSPNPAMTKVHEKVIAAGSTAEFGYSPLGIVGTNSGHLELSVIPPIDLGRRLKYLLSYPHGCVEQTTSKAFPQLFLSDVMDLDKEAIEQAERNVKSAIKRLASFQQPNGGFSYWAGSNSINDWGTSYAGHFMLEAELKGFVFPHDVRSKWIEYQKKTARSWRKSGRSSKQWTELAQAYRLYTLALANAPDLGAMNRLRSSTNLKDQTKWRLAAAYQLAGKPEVSRDLIGSLSIGKIEGHKTDETFGSSERDIAMIIETLVTMGKHEEATALVRKLSKRLSGNRWLNTQATAYGLLAISKYAGSTLKDQFYYGYAINGQEERTALSTKPIVQLPLSVNDLTGGSCSIRNTNTAPLYVRLVLEGIPMAGSETVEEEQLGIELEYFLSDGTSLDESEIEQGTDIFADVTVSHPGILADYKEMALTQIFPSGWEIRNSRMDGSNGGIALTYPEYQDVRDDRVLTYFDLKKGHKAKFRIALNAAYLGEYYLPATKCEAMYDHDIRANTAGRWVKVVPPGGSTNALR